MRSPSAFSRLLVVACTLTAATSVRADDKQDCSSAYDQTQLMQRAGSLQAAHKQAVSCLREVCAAFVREDCAKWLAEIEQSQPSVVLDVRGAADAPLTHVEVWLDGKLWIAAKDALAGRAVPIDPGAHTLRFVSDDDAVTVEEQVRILEGEKNRRVVVSLALPRVPVIEPPPVVAPLTELKPLATAIEAPGPSPASWIFGGVGIAGLVVGAITGVLVVHDKSVVNGDCSKVNGALVCREQTGVDATDQGKLLGPVTTVALLAGGALVGTGIVLWATRRRGPTTPGPLPPTAFMRAAMGPSGGTLTLVGSF